MKIQIKLFLGALALVGLQAHAQVVNGGFETGDFTGWTQGGNTGFTGVTGPFDGMNPNSGDFFADLGPVGSDGVLSQTLAVDPLADYTVSFFLASDGGTENDFTASFGGNVLYSVTDLAQQGMTEYSFTAAGGTGVLEFDFRNDPGYLGLDDVSVTPAVPDSASTMGLMSVGLVGLGGIARRFRR